MKLHRDLGITQKSAWRLAHRIRETWGDFEPTFEGLVEADETFVGGGEKNEHGDKKLRAGRGTAGKAMMVGVKDRETICVSAAHVAGTLVPFVTDRTATEATIYTDEHRGYRTLPRLHKTVKHSLGQYVDGQGPHERDQIVLGTVQARLSRDLLPDVAQTPELLRLGVRRSP